MTTHFYSVSTQFLLPTHNYRKTYTTLGSRRPPNEVPTGDATNAKDEPGQPYKTFKRETFMKDKTPEMG
jgi:hypothetical protein